MEDLNFQYVKRAFEARFHQDRFSDIENLHAAGGGTLERAGMCMAVECRNNLSSVQGFR